MLALKETVQSGLQVLPGSDWGLHYPISKEDRAAKLHALHAGKLTSEQVFPYLVPNAIFYDPHDIEREGFDIVQSRIRDIAARIAFYDYPRFAQFIESMQGFEVSLDTLEDFYSGLSGSRTGRKTLDAYGYTGRVQIEQALVQESKRLQSSLETLPVIKKVLGALKLDWLADNTGLIPVIERDQAVAKLSGSERDLFHALAASYKAYVEEGNEQAYINLVEELRKGLPKTERQGDEQKPSESMQKLEEELKEYEDQVGPPATPLDPAIPPDDSDEYHTPPPGSVGASGSEGKKAAPFFEITPPLGGWYAAGRKSYFDIDTKTWSKKKQLTHYGESIFGAERYTIAGHGESGLKALPLPTGYTLDCASLSYTGAKPEFFRDQNGCFYYECQGAGSFSIDFLKQDTPFSCPPQGEDTASLYRGVLSSKTERAILQLIGTPTEKAEQARQYILANHFYPGGGDLTKAQALQYKLRTESTGDTYLQNIDLSEYLECYSANTKFVAMMRKAGVPARLVTGHKVEGATNGTSVMNTQTGHAWSEIWDGALWRRFDATPQPKPEDIQADKKGDEKKEQAPEADDGGVDREDDQQESTGGQKSESGETSEEAGEAQKGAGEQSADGQPGSDVQEMSDQAMQQAEQQMKELEKKFEKMEQKKQELGDAIKHAEKFKDLAGLKKEIEEADLLDEFKEELEDQLEATEEQMKDTIKDDLDKMVEDGFMDEKRREELIQELEEKELEKLDALQKKIDQDNKLYEVYDDIREEVLPMVEEWFRYFAERLPHKDAIFLDEDSLHRQGALSRKSVMKPRNLLFGTVKNPRQIRPSIEPRFLASILVDVSGSMEGVKLKNARKLLVFYAELFSRISEVFGYIRSSIHIFSDTLTEIKKFDQQYDSSERYQYTDGQRATVKLRLMERLKTAGGTNMLDAITQTAQELNEESAEYPDYASALYFIGDGGDTCGNAERIKRFMQTNNAEHGFGEHMYTATLLGNESQREELARIFGDDHTNVAPDFDALVEQSMRNFEEDIEQYLLSKNAV